MPEVICSHVLTAGYIHAAIQITSANSTWFCYKNAALLALVNLRSTNCPHVLSAGRTRPELSNVGPKYKAKLLTNMRQSAGN